MPDSVRIKTRLFDFRRLVFAHGWVYLAPFEWDEANQTLTRPLRMTSGRSVSVSIRSATGAACSQLSVVFTERLLPADRSAVREQVRWMFRLNEDYSDFRAACADDPMLAFVARHNCGGMLRGANAFEDLIKTVCTVNCDWRNTKRMCQRLCDLDPDGNFPQPDRLSRLPEAKLAEKTSLGYRARTVRALASLAARGDLPLEEWTRQGHFDRVAAALEPVWGIGPYALNHVLVLLGRYDVIPVDGEVLKYLRETHFKGRAVSERRAAEPYERYGRFKYLAFKFGRIARRENYINKER